MNVFAQFAPRLQEAIVARLGWSSLREVQEQAGEALLAGMNAIVLAPTAGGKTEAAIFPMLSDMVENPPDGVAAIYVAPIKALLNNQSHRLDLYTEMVGLKRFVWHGDTPAGARRRFLEEPARSSVRRAKAFCRRLRSSNWRRRAGWKAWTSIIAVGPC